MAGSPTDVKVETQSIPCYSNDDQHLASASPDVQHSMVPRIPPTVALQDNVLELEASVAASRGPGESLAVNGLTHPDSRSLPN